VVKKKKKAIVWTHIGILKKTKKQITMLAEIQGKKIYEMIGLWADHAWGKAKADGIVKDELLMGHHEHRFEGSNDG